MAKIAVEKSTGLVWEAWGDGYQLEFGRRGLEVRLHDELKTTYGYMNASEYSIWEAVTSVPEDFTATKYIHDGTSWSLNAEWTEDIPPNPVEE